MFLEIAQIEVKPGMEAEFEANVATASVIFRAAKGCIGFDLQRSVEWPTRYRLFVKWITLENHTVDFRGSAGFSQWRALVGRCFAAPPEVEHTVSVIEGF